MSNNHSDLPPLNEPVTVPCMAITGIDIDAGEQVTHLTGWVVLPRPYGERRVAGRWVLTNECFRKLLADGRRSLARGGH